ncbi:DUF1885 family protein [Thalassobacillus hwangdonensis]|uniref:DUF1885 family protein n=1 Tax=Thalassobacillus hwangdonensis TaxID=546108 RepID=A0ABW3KVV4_9BACI
MGQSAYVYLVPESNHEELSLQNVHELLLYYRDITAKTGEQLGWNYADHSFPYTWKDISDEHGEYTILSGTNKEYNKLLIGVGKTEKNDGEMTAYIQITLTEASTHGDKSKGNELAKFLAKKLEAKLQLFNGRIMYYYKRKLA